MTRAAPVRVHVLVLRRCVPFVSVGVYDLLRKSSELASTLPAAPRRRLEVKLVSGTSERDVEVAGGLTLSAGAVLATAGACDVAVVPALDPDVGESVDQNRAVLPWLSRLHARGGEIASACTGAFVLGEAGLLDGRRATTHWAFQKELAERYPRVELAPQAVVVDDRRVVTAGGATSFINLAHFLVERLLGPEVAWAASRMFLIDPNKSPQGAYAIFSSQKDHADEPILRAQEILEREVGSAPPVEELARRVALSQRTFLRRFQAATGEAPRTYGLRVRVEAAKRALERGGSVSEVAARVGYEDVVAFRKTFSRVVGLTPFEYRTRYGPRSAPAVEVSPRRPDRRGAGGKP